MPPHDPFVSDWPENKNLINYRLDRVDEALEDITTRLLAIDTRITGLAVKASIFGGIGGLICGTIFTELVGKFFR